MNSTLLSTQIYRSKIAILKPPANDLASGVRIGTIPTAVVGESPLTVDVSQRNDNAIRFASFANMGSGSSIPATALIGGDNTTAYV